VLLLRLQRRQVVVVAVTTLVSGLGLAQQPLLGLGQATHTSQVRARVQPVVLVLVTHTSQVLVLVQLLLRVLVLVHMVEGLVQLLLLVLVLVVLTTLVEGLVQQLLQQQEQGAVAA
jgi:hypothetical protein